MKGFLLGFAILVACVQEVIAMGTEGIARYILAGAGEGETPLVAEAWIEANGWEELDGKSFQWWNLVMRKSDGGVMAIRVLSERAPMTTPEGPGQIVRYIYKPVAGNALEYVDKSTGHALLPGLDFQRTALPWPAPDARYDSGFATTGTLLGYLASKSVSVGDMPVVDFSKPKRLEIRTDFMIGTSRIFKDNGIVPKPGDDWTYVLWTGDDIRAMVEAGFNWFNSNAELRRFLEEEPAFFRGEMVFPDDLYRSNFRSEAMFIDEPMTRMGWSGPLVEDPSGPEMVAQALRLRVAYEEKKVARLIGMWGTLELKQPPAPSWETEYWSAWYQLQAGAPGLVHEGRYVHRGFGYEPEVLFGAGLDGLKPRDQFNFIYAFLRGAARSFGGYWGVSIYGQSDPELRMPALIRAYEMGAKHLWFWTSDHGHHVPFTEQLRLAREICEYANQHPRPDAETLLKKAEVGIALPPGYAFNWKGTWGMRKAEKNRAGVLYSDISAVMAWEGIICSRRGIEFDFLVDHPGIEKLGYKRLVIIQEDGTVRVEPPWEQRAPQKVRVESISLPESPISQRQKVQAEHIVKLAEGVRIDGELSDWANAEWIRLGASKWFGDNREIVMRISLPEYESPALGNSFLGMTFTRLTEELRQKYALEAHSAEELLVVTNVEAKSPAEKAGVKEGDIILELAGRQIRHDMHIHEISRKYAKSPGSEIEIKVRRSGLDLYGGESDLSADVAFMVDNSYLYFAAKVLDDTHFQEQSRWYLWTHDCVQIALDPILDRHEMGYGDNNHEIGFALKDGKPLVWRWDGRPNQPKDYMETAKAVVRRDGNFTIYETAIPLSKLMPLAPGVWPKFGANIVVNDYDGEGTPRKGRLELVPGANTFGHHPDRFAVFQCEGPAGPDAVSAGLIWEKRAMPEGGNLEFLLGISSPNVKQAKVRAEMKSSDSPETLPASGETTIEIGRETREYRLLVKNESPPGRYKLTVSVEGENGWKAVEDTLSVYVYPK